MHAAACHARGRNLPLLPQRCGTKTNTKGNSRDVVSTLLIRSLWMLWEKKSGPQKTVRHVCCPCWDPLVGLGIGLVLM